MKVESCKLKAVVAYSLPKGEGQITKINCSPLLQHFLVGEGAVVGEPKASRTNAGEVRGWGEGWILKE